MDIDEVKISVLQYQELLDCKEAQKQLEYKNSCLKSQIETLKVLVGATVKNRDELALKVKAEEEKPLPCPFCGRDGIIVKEVEEDTWQCRCNDCDYRANSYRSRAPAIAAHNRVAKAVRESEGKA